VVAGIFGLAAPASATTYDDICVEVDVYGVVNLHPVPICVQYGGPVFCNTIKLGEPSSPFFYAEVLTCTPQ
jgi:hypothetical protein